MYLGWQKCPWWDKGREVQGYKAGTDQGAEWGALCSSRGARGAAVPGWACACSIGVPESSVSRPEPEPGGERQEAARGGWKPTCGFKGKADFLWNCFWTVRFLLKTKLVSSLSFLNTFYLKIFSSILMTTDYFKSWYDKTSAKQDRYLRLPVAFRIIGY